MGRVPGRAGHAPAEGADLRDSSVGVLDSEVRRPVRGNLSREGGVQLTDAAHVDTTHFQGGVVEADIADVTEFVAENLLIERLVVVEVVAEVLVPAERPRLVGQPDADVRAGLPDA